MDKLVIGCGYLGRRVASAWAAAGARVGVLTRSTARAAEFAAAGWEPLVGDVAEPQSLARLETLGPLHTVLYALGYDPRGGRTRDEVQVAGLAQVLDRLAGRVERLIFISTTGVYGTAGGDWIDESSPTVPEGESGRAALAAEQTLLAHSLGQCSVILRLAGIYGPGRLPKVEALARGEPLTVDPQSYLNLIHVDDAVRVVLAAESQAPLPRLYLVSDGHPCRRGEYYGELARLIGAPPPRFIAPSVGGPAVGRPITDKRVSRARLERELTVAWQFPDFRAGLKASWTRPTRDA